MSDRIWLWFADNGNIRKWQREPFPEGTEYVVAAQADAEADYASRIRSALVATPPAEQHPDDIAVDCFAAAMKAKLKWEREQRNRSGWQAMSAADLSRILYEHLPKGDPVDVANLSMMLHQNGQQIETPPAEPVVEALLSWVCEDVLPAYGVSGEIARNDPELAESCRSALAAKDGRS